MDLWVRSQDREDLIKVDRLAVNDNRIEANFKLFYSGCDYLVLGIYETNERALEVLDEIQEYLEKMGKDEILTDKLGIMSGIKHYGIVYEMPEE